MSRLKQLTLLLELEGKVWEYFHRLKTKFQVCKMLGQQQKVQIIHRLKKLKIKIKRQVGHQSPLEFLRQLLVKDSWKEEINRFNLVMRSKMLSEISRNKLKRLLFHTSNLTILKEETSFLKWQMWVELQKQLADRVEDKWCMEMLSLGLRTKKLMELISTIYSVLMDHKVLKGRDERL